MSAFIFYSSLRFNTNCIRENYCTTEPLLQTSITHKLVSLHHQFNWPNPHVTAVTASQRSCSHPATPGPARAGSLHVLRISLSQTHRSRSFYSSRRLNENQHMNLYIPDSSQNLNYCGNKPCVHESTSIRKC